jgi:hypothetical protein
MADVLVNGKTLPGTRRSQYEDTVHTSRVIRHLNEDIMYFRYLRQYNIFAE